MKKLAAALVFLSAVMAHAGGVSPQCPSGAGATNCYKTLAASEIENIEVAGDLVIFRWNGRSARDVEFHGSANQAMANRILAMLLTAKGNGSNIIIYITGGDWGDSGTSALRFSNVVIP